MKMKIDDSPGKTGWRVSNKQVWVTVPLLTASMWIACQSGSIVGDMLIDAGDALKDTGPPKATAQQPDTLQRACDVEQDWTMTAPDGSKSSTTQWFAEVSLADGDEGKIYRVDIILCSYTSYTAPVTCPTGFVCEGALYPFGQPNCESSASANIKANKLWVSCGARHRNWNASGQLTSDSGRKAATASISIWRS